MRLIVLLAILIGCTTNSNQPKKIDTEIEVKGQVGNSKVGLNKQNEMIMQEETQAEDELMVIETVNLRLRDEFEYQSHKLKQCRTQLSDERLGGTGQIPPIPEVDTMKSPDVVREEIGLASDGTLKVVRKSYFIEKLKAERKFKSSLDTMNKALTRHNEECEYKLAKARRASGLPGQKYQGKGYYTRDGLWIQTAPEEDTLDDAFEIQAKSKKKSGE